MPIEKLAALFIVGIGTLMAVVGAYSDGWAKHLMVICGASLAALGVAAIWLEWNV